VSLPVSISAVLCAGEQRKDLDQLAGRAGPFPIRSGTGDIMWDLPRGEGSRPRFPGASKWVAPSGPFISAVEAEILDRNIPKLRIARKG
jgi:hypothetical protein